MVVHSRDIEVIASDSSMVLPRPTDLADGDWVWNWLRTMIADRTNKDQTGGAFGSTIFHSKRAS